MMLAIVWILWACLNGFVFLLYGLDKLKAKRNKWRVPERTLLLFTWLMGGVGAFAGMRVFRHKTKHWYFQFGMPAILLVQIVLVGWLIWKLNL